MRGEHGAWLATGGTLSGSSPHARGTPSFPSLSEQPPGIIPACAGNTPSVISTRRWSRDHPRMRGEHTLPVRLPLASWGSSPHARGTPHHIDHGATQLGIIPACAGNTGVGGGGGGVCWDHPRMRGEHLGSTSNGVPAWGSSPHARGTLVFSIGIIPSLGIIPACAGNTQRVIHIAHHVVDHPRMRGEHHRAWLRSSADAGSSPHARGTQHDELSEHVAPGIIPACAGNTRTSDTHATYPRDHPRMRGEHGFDGDDFVSAEGSSPHARGTQGR